MSSQVRHILFAAVDVIFGHRKTKIVVVESRFVNFSGENLIPQNEEVDQDDTKQGHKEVIAGSYRRKTIHQIVRYVTVATQVLHKEEQMDVQPKSISVSICVPQHQPSQVFEHDN